VLGGARQPGRERVFTVFHETSGKQRFEMRAVQEARFAYIFNPWSDGKRVFRNESQSGLTFTAMREAAEADPRIAERVRFFQHRVPEEFYDLQADPDALRNLIGEAKLKPEIDRLRGLLRDNMERTGDPLKSRPGV